MDRADFKERMLRVDTLLDEEKYEDALDLMDSINWRKVHNVNFLLEGADKYDRMGKTYDSKELLEIAHERSPMGRMIIYKLALCCSNLGEIEEAKEYYQKFIEIAPNDNVKFIIKYAINKMSGADDYTLISILEELRSNELLEDWAYELACLYRKTGQVDKCVMVLDDIILWFGEGPYVERAFEMKLLYRPLTKDQEIKYQHLTTQGSSVVEIHPGERVAKDEFLGRTIRIPEIEESKEKYNTHNLQAEIRKNIEEIMKASEMGEVTDNIDAIKGLIEDIPHIQMKEENEVETAEQRKFNTKRLDEELKSNFKEYLSEEFDGQISLAETGREREDDQIDGQLTIEEIMDRWEKTRRAAEQALLDAKALELMRYKEQALQRASDVLDRLIESEGGIPPRKEQENEKSESVEEIKEEKEEVKEPEEKAEDEPKDSEESVKQDENKSSLEEQKTFKIPKIVAVGEPEGVGFEIPIISAEEAGKVISPIEETEEPKEAPEEVSVEQEETPEEVSAEPEEATEETPVEAEEAPKKLQQSPEDALKDINAMLQSEIDKLISEDEGTAAPKVVEEKVEEEKKPLGNTTTNLPLIDISDFGEEVSIQTQLTPREKELLSYFASIPGMEMPLVHLIANVREAFAHPAPRNSGHIVIHGREGSGRTRLAQNIIKVIQDETGQVTGNLGRISGDKLNEKDIRVLFEKISGGALIVENAGKIAKETLVSLNLVMENDRSGTLVILEDIRSRIDALLRSDVRFAQRFTEKINIPIMTIDELVKFGKIYAAENGFGIDEMGVLALYDRINLSGSPDKPASIRDVKEIIDDAVSAQSSTKFKGLFGLFGSKGADDSGFPILQEKDFREG